MASSIGAFQLSYRKKLPTLTNVFFLHAVCSALDPRFQDISFFFLSAQSAKELQKNFVHPFIVEAANADDNDGERSAKKPCVSQHSGLSRLLKRNCSMPKSASARIEREVMLYFTDVAPDMTMKTLSLGGEEMGHAFPHWLVWPVDTFASQLPQFQRKVFLVCDLINKLRSSLSPEKMDALVFFARIDFCSWLSSPELMTGQVPSSSCTLFQKASCEACCLHSLTRSVPVLTENGDACDSDSDGGL